VKKFFAKKKKRISPPKCWGGKPLPFYEHLGGIREKKSRGRVNLGALDSGGLRAKGRPKRKVKKKKAQQGELNEVLRRSTARWGPEPKAKRTYRRGSVGGTKITPFDSFYQEDSKLGLGPGEYREVQENATIPRPKTEHKARRVGEGPRCNSHGRSLRGLQPIGLGVEQQWRASK